MLSHAHFDHSGRRAVDGLSAHADQAGLVNWYLAFAGSPPVFLVRGDSLAQTTLADILREQTGTAPQLPSRLDRADLSPFARVAP